MIFSSSSFVLDPTIASPPRDYNESGRPIRLRTKTLARSNEHINTIIGFSLNSLNRPLESSTPRAKLPPSMVPRKSIMQCELLAAAIFLFHLRMVLVRVDLTFRPPFLHSENSPKRVSLRQEKNTPSQLYPAAPAAPGLHARLLRMKGAWLLFLFSAMFHFLFFQLAQIVVQAIKSLLPGPDFLSNCSAVKRPLSGRPLLCSLSRISAITTACPLRSIKPQRG